MSKLYLTLILVIIGGCASKELAIIAVDKLDNVSKQREEILVEQFANLIKSYIDVSQLQIDSSIDSGESKLQAKVISRIRQKESELLETAITKVDNAFEKEISKARDKLIKAQGVAQQTGDRSKEQEAATELATALAVHATELNKQVDRIIMRFRGVETEVNLKINEGFSSLRSDEFLRIDKQVNTDELLSQLNKGSEAYLVAIGDGFTEVRRYIQDSDAQISFLAKGFLGDDFGGKLSDIVKDKVDSFVNKSKAKIQKKITEVNSEISSIVD